MLAYLESFKVKQIAKWERGIRQDLIAPHKAMRRAKTEATHETSQEKNRKCSRKPILAEVKQSPGNSVRQGFIHIPDYVPCTTVSQF